MGKQDYNKKSMIFSLKEFFDSLAFGFMPNQFINIIFYSLLISTGFSFIFVGLSNILKSVLSLLTDFFIGDSKLYDSKRIIYFVRYSSLIYSFSFFLMLVSLIYGYTMLFFITLIISGISISSQGLLYRSLVRRELKFGYLESFYKNVRYFTIISVIASVISSFLFITVKSVVIPLEVSTISFILSSYILFFLNIDEDIAEYTQKISLKDRFKSYYKEFLQNVSFKNRFFILLVSFFNAIVLLSYSYAGIFIYENYRFFYFTEYTNLAFIFGISIIISMLLSNKIIHLISSNYGQLPVIVFGSFLFTLMPMTFYFAPNFFTILFACSIAVLGSSIARISFEVYMIKEEINSKFNNLIMAFVLLLSILLLFFISSYEFLYLIMFILGIFVSFGFFILLFYEEVYFKK